MDEFTGSSTTGLTFSDTSLAGLTEESKQTGSTETVGTETIEETRQTGSTGLTESVGTETSIQITTKVHSTEPTTEKTPTSTKKGDPTTKPEPSSTKDKLTSLFTTSTVN